MLRPEFNTTAMRPTAATTPTASSAGLRGAGAGGFGALYGELQGDVADFIANGTSGGNMPNDVPNDAPPMPALSAEGSAYRNQLIGRLAAPDAAVDSAAQQDFLAAIAPAAEAAGEQLGVAPEIVAAHAALESGWGKRPLRQADGSDAHNLFGIKAGAGWQGDVTRALTTEQVDGVPTKSVEAFRSYPGSASGFRDYAKLLLDNPRYQPALNTGSDARAFAKGLAKGGYATDPAYADKLTRLAARIQSAR